MVEINKEDRNTKALNTKKVKEHVKRASFAAVEKEEAQEVYDISQGIIDDKRRNYVQALKDLAINNMMLNEQIEYHRLWEDCIDKEVKDEMGIVYSKELKIMKARRMFTQIRFDSAKVTQDKVNIMKTWSVDDKKIEKQINDWILGKQKIY